jgi:hypothetical protein
MLAVFCRSFSFDLVTRVWDVLLLEGDIKIVYRVSLAILQSVENSLLALAFDKIMGFLRNLPDRIDSYSIVDRAFTIPLRHRDIEKAEQQVI